MKIREDGEETAVLKKVENVRTAGRVAPDQVAALAARRILERILVDYHGPVAIRLWNGDIVHGESDAPCVVVFHQPAALRELVLYRDLVDLAEAYLAGEIDVEGDLECLFDLAPYLQQLVLPWMGKWWLLRQALGLPGNRVACF